MGKKMLEQRVSQLRECRETYSVEVVKELAGKTFGDFFPENKSLVRVIAADVGIPTITDLYETTYLQLAAMISGLLDSTKEENREKGRKALHYLAKVVAQV